MNGLNAFEAAVGNAAYNKKICLQFGAPGPSALREVATLMKESTLRQFSDFQEQPEETLQYGCDTGNPEFKNELAKFLTERYRNPVSSEDLFVTTGATQGLADLLTQYFRPGDTLFLGDPTYWTLLGTIKEYAKVNIVSVKVDEFGMKIDELEKEVQKLKPTQLHEQRRFKAGVYIIPTYQNPTTVCLSPDRCKQLVTLARKHDLLVMSDDVYNILTYSSPDCDDAALAKPPTRLFHYDNKSDPGYKGNVVSIGTFSKLLAPGLRLGWYEAPSNVVQDFAKSLVSNSGDGRNPYTSGIVGAGMKAGLVQKHVEKVRLKYAERMKRVHEIISLSLEKYGVKCSLPGGGIFLWILLPVGVSADYALELSNKEITFIAGKKCSFAGCCGNGIRICISFYEPEVLYPAVSKLCQYLIQAINDSAK